MNKLENQAIKQQIDFEKYKNYEANEVIKLLDNANRELKYYITTTTDVATKKRYNEIAKKLRDISISLKKNVDKQTDIDGVIDYELKRQKSLLKIIKNSITNTQGREINFLYPAKEQIRSAALFKPIDKNLTYQSYLEGIESGFYNVWDSAVRAGYLAGIPTNDIVQNVLGKSSKIGQLQKPGTMRSVYNNIYSNTRTVLQSFAEVTKEKVYKENEHFFGDGETDYKYERVATLDSKTCLVCANLDGKLYKTLEEAQHVILHRGDRCVLLPYFNIVGDMRASKNGYVERVTFSDWLQDQDEKTKIDVLGRTRYELYRRGETIKQFIDNGSVLTLEQLNKRIDIEEKLNQNIHKPDKTSITDHFFI